MNIHDKPASQLFLRTVLMYNLRSVSWDPGLHSAPLQVLCMVMPCTQVVLHRSCLTWFDGVYLQFTFPVEATLHVWQHLVYSPCRQLVCIKSRCLGSQQFKWLIEEFVPNREQWFKARIQGLKINVYTFCNLVCNSFSKYFLLLFLLLEENRMYF